jgi:hypothetical protein
MTIFKESVFSGAKIVQRRELENGVTVVRAIGRGQGISSDDSTLETFLRMASKPNTKIPQLVDSSLYTVFLHNIFGLQVGGGDAKIVRSINGDNSIPVDKRSKNLRNGI